MTVYFVSVPVADHVLIRASQFNDLQQRIVDAFTLLPPAGSYQNGLVLGAVAGGTPNVITLDPIAGTLAAYAANQMYGFTATADNTGPVSINISALGAIALRAWDNSDLQAGDIKAGQFVMIGHNGTNFRLVSVLGSMDTRVSANAVSAAASAAAAAASAAAASVSAAAVNAWSSAITVSGSNVGIGGAATDRLTVTKVTNSAAQIRMVNSHAGNAAGMQIVLDNGTSPAVFAHYGVNYAGGGVVRANGTLYGGFGTGGVTLASLAAASVYIGTNGIQRLEVNSNGCVGLGVAADNSYFLKIGGNLQVVTDVNIGGDFFGAHYVSAPAGYGKYRVSGFGNNIDYAQGIFTSDGTGFDITCVSAGVHLANGGTSWSAISRRANKKDIQPIPGDPFDIINSLEVALFHYLEDDADRQLRPGMFYDDAIVHYPWGTTTLAGCEQTCPTSGETMVVPPYYGLSLEQFVPLLMAAFQKQITVNAALATRITTLESAP